MISGYGPVLLLSLGGMFGFDPPVAPPFVRPRVEYLSSCETCHAAPGYPICLSPQPAFRVVLICFDFSYSSTPSSFSTSTYHISPAADASPSHTHQSPIGASPLWYITGMSVSLLPPRPLQPRQLPLIVKPFGPPKLSFALLPGPRKEATETSRLQYLIKQGELGNEDQDPRLPLAISRAPSDSFSLMDERRAATAQSLLPAPISDPFVHCQQSLLTSTTLPGPLSDGKRKETAEQ